jgi:hypothetical protein
MTPSLTGVAVWDELRLTLARLLEEQPGALTRYPDPGRSEGGPPPYTIRLAPWAEAVAGELSRRFGDQVEITVGALPYPPGQPPRRPVLQRGHPSEPADMLDPGEVEVELDGPAVVRTGRTLHHGLVVRNHTGGELQIATNGHITAGVVDPLTSEVVGGFSGWQTLPLLMFRIPPGGTDVIPLLVGTASYTPRLGRKIPPGDWGLEATLSLAGDHGERSLRRTPVLPLTVTT